MLIGAGTAPDETSELGAAPVADAVQDTAPPSSEPPPTAPPETEPPATEPPPTEPPPTEPPPPPATEPPSVPTSQGFQLVSFQLSEDFINDFEGVGQVVDTAGGRSAGFTITLFINDRIVGTLSGSIQSAPQGQPVTVQFITTDDFVTGVERYQFQTDFAF